VVVVVIACSLRSADPAPASHHSYERPCRERTRTTKFLKHGHALDPGYIAGLSGDALPAVARDRSLDEERGRSEFRDAFSCGARSTGAAACTIAPVRADDARRRLRSDRTGSLSAIDGLAEPTSLARTDARCVEE